MLKSYLPAVVWSVVILILSAYPGNQLPKVPDWQIDKLVHTSIYAVLVVLMLMAVYPQFSNPKKRLKTVIIVVVLGIIYGGIMELLQHYIFINRSGNYYDFLANTLGAFLGAFLFPISLKMWPINRWLKIK